MDAVSTFGDVEDPWNIQCRKSPYGCEWIRSLSNVEISRAGFASAEVSGSAILISLEG
jgi:hypothetical protein